jgi:hypothetical protein
LLKRTPPKAQQEEGSLHHKKAHPRITKAHPLHQLLKLLQPFRGGY